MGISGKHFVFRYYVPIALVFGALAIGWVDRFGSTDRYPLIATILGGVFGFCYITQQQKLEDSRLFKDLFTDFNRRYDDMNADLQEIYDNCPNVNPDQRKKLVDYFNLCAEEYLFYEEGYIHPKAWRAWCRGMTFYFEKDCIRKVWDEEVRSDSYYGLTLEIVRKGTNL